MTALALRLKRSGHIPVLAAAGCTVVLLLVGSVYSQNFLSAEYLLLQLQIASFLGIIATGAMLVILLGVYPQPVLDVINPTAERTMVDAGYTDPVPAIDAPLGGGQ